MIHVRVRIALPRACASACPCDILESLVTTILSVLCNAALVIHVVANNRSDTKSVPPATPSYWVSSRANHGTRELSQAAGDAPGHPNTAHLVAC